MNHGANVEYLRHYLQDRCGGCGVEHYQGDKTYFVATLHGTEFSAWFCRACNERLQNQTKTFFSMGAVTIPLPNKEPA